MLGKFCDPRGLRLKNTVRYKIRAIFKKTIIPVLQNPAIQSTTRLAQEWPGTFRVQGGVPKSVSRRGTLVPGYQECELDSNINSNINSNTNSNAAADNEKKMNSSADTDAA